MTQFAAPFSYVFAALDLRGAINVILILIVAGAIAFIGDRVGHVVGRRRLTLFGLRPRYTSTISAIVFGMLIALVALGFVSLFVKNARIALFSISQLNDEITALSADRDRLIQFMKEDPLIFRKDEVLTVPVTVSSRQDEKAIRRQLALFFVEVANYYRRAYPQVKPYPKDPLTAPGVSKNLDKAAGYVKSFEPADAIILPVAGENIFSGTNMAISFDVYKDVLLYRKGEIIASVEVRNAKNVDADRQALFGLSQSLVANATSHGMPLVIANPPPSPPTSGDQILAQLTALGGPAVLTAVAQRDIYAEGPLLWDVAVSAGAK